MEKSIEKVIHLGVDFWKTILLRSHEKSKKIKLSQRLTAKRSVKKSKVKGGFSVQYPKGRANPSPPGHKSPHPHFSTSFPSNPFPFLSLPFPSLPLSSLVLACLGVSWLDFSSQLGSNLASQTHPNPDKMESRRPSLS